MPKAKSSSPWDKAYCQALIDELLSLRQELLKAEKLLAPYLDSVAPTYRKSARNFAHYLALRQHDLRTLQERLAQLGLSSLGRSESNVLANLDKVLGILHRLADLPWEPLAEDEPVGIKQAAQQLQAHTEALFGKAPDKRQVRIMVTLPSSAACDGDLLEALVAAGMDIARINCAHDHPTAWREMAKNVQAAAKRHKKQVLILADLAGPKLRTLLPPAPPVLPLKAKHDDYGRLLAPARLILYPNDAYPPENHFEAALAVAPNWFAQLQQGDRLYLTDIRGKARKLTVVHRAPHWAMVECEKSCYLSPETTIRFYHHATKEAQSGEKNKQQETFLFRFPERPGKRVLHRGDLITLVPAATSHELAQADPNAIGCTLHEIFSQVGKGEPIWFDDGKIGAIVRSVAPNQLTVEITHARDEGETLTSDKGINLPESTLTLPALTPKDLEDLQEVCQFADLVGLSFAQRGRDITALRKALTSLGRPEMGIVIKVETKRAFANLPELIFAAMTAPAAGLMIARGDLAVECGYERLAEVQEEILWAAEAAHLPVIWATQVLETLAKKGLPSRAEITDAAMAERAECVMLNKGPHIVEAVCTLDDILRRMQAHQAKKRSLLRALHSWSLSSLTAANEEPKP